MYVISRQVAGEFIARRAATSPMMSWRCKGKRTLPRTGRSPSHLTPCYVLNPHCVTYAVTTTTAAAKVRGIVEERAALFTAVPSVQHPALLPRCLSAFHLIALSLICRRPAVGPYERCCRPTRA